MNASAKLVIALVVILAICVLGLSIQSIYVFWRKKRFRRRSALSGGARSVDSQLSNSSFYAPPSKELLYFFCWKNQLARVEPSAGVVSPTPAEPAAAGDSEADAPEADDEELAKWQALYGQSRLLYTIKEEEKEGADTVENSADKNEAKSEDRVSLRDRFSGPVEMADDMDMVAIEPGLEQATTPFLTPCASPLYFTPSPSPSRDVDIWILPGPENDDISLRASDVLTERKLEFVSYKSKTSAW